MKKYYLLFPIVIVLMIIGCSSDPLYIEEPILETKGVSGDNVPSLEYSSLIIDLVDSNNQMGYYKYKNPNSKSYRRYPNDNVGKFELSRIYNALLGSTGVGSFKTEIKN